jgi:hypothetical protein
MLAPCIHISVTASEHNDPDHSCMVRLIAGDDLALSELMERWQKPLHSFILRYVGNYADSIELAQETFVRVYHHRSRFNFKSKFSTWLLTIATNLCRHHARWRKRHPTLNFLLDSGAGISAIDLQTARRLGVPLGNRHMVQGVNGQCRADLAFGMPTGRRAPAGFRLGSPDR